MKNSLETMNMPNFDVRMQTTILSIFFCIVMVANGNHVAEQASAGSRRHFMILQPLRLITSVSASGASRHISSSGLGASRATVKGNYPLLPMIDIRNNKFRSADVLSAPVAGSHMTNGHVKSIQQNKSLTHVDNSSNAVNKGSQAFVDSRWSSENNSSRNVKQTVIIANTANIITQHPGDNNVMTSRQRSSSIVINNNNVHGKGVMNNNRAHGGSSIVNDIRNNIRPLQRIPRVNSSKTHPPSDALPWSLARSQPIQTIDISSASSSANVITNTGPGSPNLKIHGQEGAGGQINSDHSHQRHTPRYDPTLEQNATLLAVAITKAILQYPETRTMLGQPRTNASGTQPLLSSLFAETQVHNNLSSVNAESSILLQNTLPVASTAQSASPNTSFIDSFTPHASPSPWELNQNQNIPHGQHPPDARNNQRGPVRTEPTLRHTVPTTNAISNNGNINVMPRLPSNAGTFGIPTFNGHGTIGSRHSNIVHSETKIDIRPSIHINPSSNIGFRPITSPPSWIIGGPYNNVPQGYNPSIHSQIPSSNSISVPPATNSPLHRQGNQSINFYGTAITSILSLLNILGNTTLHRIPAQTQPSLSIGHLLDTSAQGLMSFFGAAHEHGSTAGPLNRTHNNSGGHQPGGPLNHGRSNFNAHQQGTPTGPHDPVHSQSSANQPFGNLNRGHSNSNGHQQGNPAWPHDPVRSHSSVNQLAEPLNHGHGNFNGHQQGNPSWPHDPVHSHSSTNLPAGPLNHGHSNSNSRQQGDPSNNPANSHLSANQPGGSLNHGHSNSNGHQQGNPAWPHDPVNSHLKANQPGSPINHGHSNSSGHQQGYPTRPHDPVHSQSGANQPFGKLNHGHSNSNGHQQGNPSGPHDPVYNHSSVNQLAGPLYHGHGNFNSHLQGNLSWPHDPVHSHSSVNQPAGPLNHGHSNSNSHQQGNPSGPHDPVHSHSSANQPTGPLNHGHSNSNSHQRSTPTGPHDPVHSQSGANLPFGKLNHGHTNSTGHQQGNSSGPHDRVHSHSSVSQSTGPLNHGHSNSSGHQQGNPSGPHDPVHSHSSANQPTGPLNHGHSNSNSHQQGTPTGPHDPVHSQSSANQTFGKLIHGHSNSTGHQQGIPSGPHDPVHSHSSVSQPTGPLNHGHSNSNSHQQGTPTGPHDPVHSQSSANQTFGKLIHGHSNSTGHQQGIPSGPHDPVHSHSSINQPAGPLNHGHSTSNSHQQGNPSGPHDPVHSHSSANQPTGPLNHGHSNSNSHQQGTPTGPHDPVHSQSSANQAFGKLIHGHSNSSGHQQGNPSGPHDPVNSHLSANQPTGLLNLGHRNSNGHQQGNTAWPLDPVHSQSSVNHLHGQLDFASGSQHGIQAGQAEHFGLPNHQVHLNTSRQMQVQIALRNEINSQLRHDIQHLIQRKTQGHSPSNTNINMGTHVSDHHQTQPRPQRSIETTMDGFIGRYDSLTRMKRAALNLINKSTPDSGTRNAGNGNVGTFQSSHQQTENGKSGDHVSNPNRELYTPLINDVPLTWPQDFKISHVEQPGGTSQLIIEAGKGNIKKKYTVSTHSKRVNPTKTLPQLEPLKKLQSFTPNPKLTTTQTPNVTTEEPPEYEAI